MKRAVLAAAAFALTCALTYGVANAQRGDRRGGPPPGGAVGFERQGQNDDGAPSLIPSGAQLLAEARRVKDRDGCAAAAPTYRVVAAMGAGQEAAQDELGECLLAEETTNATEKTLYKQEALFWLTRAAYAGNARAQRALAVYYAPEVLGAAANAEALKWALVYQKNSDAALYGYHDLPTTLASGLKATLGPKASADAEAFAAHFTPTTLPAFTPPKLKRGKRSGGLQGGRPDHGGRDGEGRDGPDGPDDDGPGYQQ